MFSRNKTVVTLLVLSVLIACGSSQNETNTTTVNAEALFASKCSMCHDFTEKRIGPPLAGVQQRWGNDFVKLKAFIKNSQELIASGDPYASALYKEWNQSNMPSFSNLSEEELDALVNYLK